MNWTNYVAGFFSGVFLTNCVPHLIHGLSGNKFPTPFANPRGVGLSSSFLNALWGLFNLLIGYILLIVSKANTDEILSQIIIFLGIFITAVGLSIIFEKKEKEKLLG